MEINSLNTVKVIDLETNDFANFDSSASKIFYNNKIFICNVSFDLSGNHSDSDIVFEKELPFRVSRTYFSPLNSVVFSLPIDKRLPSVALVVQYNKLKIMCNDVVDFNKLSPLNSLWYIGQVVGFIND